MQHRYIHMVVTYRAQVEGQDVVEAVGKLPVVKDNSDSPFFK